MEKLGETEERAAHELTLQRIWWKSTAPHSHAELPNGMKDCAKWGKRALAIWNSGVSSSSPTYSDHRFGCHREERAQVDSMAGDLSWYENHDLVPCGFVTVG